MRFVSALLCALMVATAFAQIASPTVIPFQGRLTNQSGVAYTEGQYTLTFNLYNEAVGGTTVWTERHEKVGVINGTVNVFLGSIQTLSGVDFSGVKYLGITIDADANPLTADPEMVPRQMIIPAFWAKNSENSLKLAGNDWSAIVVDATGTASNNPSSGMLNGAKIKDATITTSKLAMGAVQSAQLAANVVTTDKIADGTITAADLSLALQQASVIPPGTIVAFGGDETKVPAGWLLCDGSALRSGNALYAALYAAIGKNYGNGTNSYVGSKYQSPSNGGTDVTDFNIPDFRGYFLRGVDKSLGATRGVDPDSAARLAMQVGSNTGNAVGSIQPSEFRYHSHAIFGGDDISSNPHINRFKGGTNGNASFQGEASSVGGNETRPINAYVNYIIKL